MSGIAPSRSTRLARRLLPLLAVALVGGVAASPSAAKAPPATQAPAPATIVAAAAARAFDHVHVARDRIAERKVHPARLELAQAATFLTRAREANPATGVGLEISALQIRLQDATAEVPAQAFDTVLAAIDAAANPTGFHATRRYVERARYFRKDGAAAARELVAAAARIPYGAIDGPLADAFARVQLAEIELAGGALPTADRVLAQAERSTLAAVQIARGGAAVWSIDVAAPPALVLAPETTAGAVEDPIGAIEGVEGTPIIEPAITESEIPAAGEFREGPAPGEFREAPAPGEFQEVPVDEKAPPGA